MKGINSSKQEVALLAWSEEQLESYSQRAKLSLSREDMKCIQCYFRDRGRNPTRVEIEVIAQTWSEHCKHRVFNARIVHRGERGEEVIEGLFQRFVKEPSERVIKNKPGFVLSAFVDNAGFIALDPRLAACFKVETHNHPSAIEPYAGANTGLGGVIRDILGAGLGACPVASLDVFCFAAPDAPEVELAGSIHPREMMRGVVAGVRDYGNRMGIPTVTGALYFASEYATNPLVFCGTAGIIERDKIAKRIDPGDWIVAVGGRTGRDGLRGATFSSATLHEASQSEDIQAVQLGNPIEEKKVADLIEEARERNLFKAITDCGAGGFSSATGEMLAETGGEIALEMALLKEEGLAAWEIFLSESQERMVVALEPQNWEALQELALKYETECCLLGKATGDNVLRVTFHGETVCSLENAFLHAAPQKQMHSVYQDRIPSTLEVVEPAQFSETLATLLGSIQLGSRAPIIRQYDHEVQGNTVGKPLAGRGGDNPQDGSVIRVGERGLALGCALLPQYGADPARMAAATVDEAIRQLVVVGADPDQIALLDNYCAGDPEDPMHLGLLVECLRGMAGAAEAFGAPFVSGKDSFYNTYRQEEELLSIPLTLLISSMGVVPSHQQRIGASLRHSQSYLAILGETRAELGGSAFLALQGLRGGEIPKTEPVGALAQYRAFHRAAQRGWISSAHDLSEGGLAVALSEMGFSTVAGIEVELNALPVSGELKVSDRLFSESSSRLLMEIEEVHLEDVQALFEGLPFAILGRTVPAHRDLTISLRGERIVHCSLAELKNVWKQSLTPYF